MGTKGLEPEASSGGGKAGEKPLYQEVRRSRSMTTGNPANEVVNSEMRLAWMFVQGWRQRLQRGEKLLEEHREEEPPSVAGVHAGDDDDEIRCSGRRSSLRKPKSVKWEL